MEEVRKQMGVSVITVVYNDAAGIRSTIDSFLSQTWPDKELIIIDGGSTDGTAEIVKEYAGKLAYWCSEHDDGLFDAMNKGVSHAKKQWVNFLNSGDSYVNSRSIEDAMTSPQAETADVVYGNSVEITAEGARFFMLAGEAAELEYYPCFRHGAAFVRTEVQKDHPFDLRRVKDLGFALDWHMLHNLYCEGYKFAHINKDIQQYQREGTSNHPLRSLWYNYKITTERKWTARKWLYMVKSGVRQVIKGTWIEKWTLAFLCEFMVNYVLPVVPFWLPRRLYLKMIGMKIGKKSFIMRSSYITAPRHISIGSYSHINRGCLLDARGGITIGDNVSVSHNVSIVTGGHDHKSPAFEGRYLPVCIKDYAWLGINSTILQNVTVGEGAVVCAGAVVTKDVEPYTIVAGVPAKVIGNRPKGLDYHCIWDSPFT